MAGAQANVQLRFLFGATDTASGTLNTVNQGLGKVQQTSTRVGGSMAALSGALGETSSGMAMFGKASNAAGATMAILPGPVGLAAAAITGIAAALYFASKASREAKAALEQTFGGSAGGVAGLKDSLGISADQAIRLQLAIDKLPASIRPTEKGLKDIARQAERAGKEGGDAAAEWADALGGTLEQMEAVSNKYHLFQAGTFSFENAARLLGTTKEIVGAKADVLTVETQIQDMAKNATVVDGARANAATQRATAEAAVLDLNARIRGIKEAISVSDGQGAAGLRLSAAFLATEKSEQEGIVKAKDAEVELYEQSLQAIERESELLKQRRGEQLEAVKIRQNIGEIQSRINVLEATANATQDEGLKTSLRTQIEQLKRESLEKSITAQFYERNTLAFGELEFAANMVIATAERAKMEKEIAAAKARASASARAQKAEAAEDKEAAGKIKILEINAKLEKDEGKRFDLQMKAIAETEAEAVRKAGKSQTAITLAHKEAELARQQLIDETAAKSQEALRKRVEDEKKAAAEIYETNKKLGEKAAASVASLDAARAKNRIEILRAAGKDEEALDAERVERHRVYDEEIRRINKEFVEGIGAGVNVDALNEVANSQTAAAQAARDHGDALSEMAKEMAKAMKWAEAFSTALEAPAASLGELGRLGISDAQMLSEQMKVAQGSAKDMAKAIVGIKKAMKDGKGETEAWAGAAAVGIGMASDMWSSYEDNRARQTQDRIDKQMQSELEGADSEEERAAITAKYEQQKADAAEAAVRRKAGIQALFETAMAVATFFINPAEAAGHAASAVMLGAIAGGLIGGGGAIGNSSGAGGGFSSGGSSSKKDKGGSSGATVINFYQPFLTKQQVGKALNESSKSLDRTGLAKVRGL